MALSACNCTSLASLPHSDGLWRFTTSLPPSATPHVHVVRWVVILGNGVDAPFTQC